MSERLDLLTKYYLRSTAAIWTGFVPFLYLISYMSGAENISFIVFLNSFFEWVILLPFGFEHSIPEDFVPLIRFFFWSFWVLTILRWVLTGRHFYQ